MKRLSRKTLQTFTDETEYMAKSMRYTHFQIAGCYVSTWQSHSGSEFYARCFMYTDSETGVTPPLITAKTQKEAVYSALCTREIINENIGAITLEDMRNTTHLDVMAHRMVMGQD